MLLAASVAVNKKSLWKCGGVTNSICPSHRQALPVSKRRMTSVGSLKRIYVMLLSALCLCENVIIEKSSKTHQQKN